MIRMKSLVVLIGILALMTPAAAQQDDTVTRMSNAANQLAAQRVEKLLEPGEILRLFVVAQQMALAENCAGYTVNMDKFSAVMSEIVRDLSKLVEPDQNNLPVDMVMSAYNISLGGMMAVASYEKKAFCNRGKEIRAKLAEDTKGRITILAD